MCGRIKAAGEVIKAGATMVFMDKGGNLQEGTWGIDAGPSGLIYNARRESMPYAWHYMEHNRGIIEIDGWYEGKSELYCHFEDNRKIHLGIIHNDHNNFLILTKPAIFPISTIHNRMPFIVDDDLTWLNKGLAIPLKSSLIVDKKQLAM